MNRRTYLGAVAAGGLAGLAGCLGTLVESAVRTKATPAFAVPPVDEWAAEGVPGTRPAFLGVRPVDESHDVGGVVGTVDVRGWLTGTQLRANNHNTTRSNRITPVAAPDGGDGAGGGFDLDAAHAYLEGEAVLGEQFVLTVPAVDAPGVDDPVASVTPVEGFPTQGGVIRLRDDGSGSPSLDGLSALTALRVDGGGETFASSSGARVHGSPRGGETGRSIPEAWLESSLAGDTDAKATSEAVVAAGVVTVSDPVEADHDLPALLYARRVRRGEDHVFVFGWVVDDARLFGNAATVLVEGARQPVLKLGDDDAVAPAPPAALVERLEDRGRAGSLVYDGPATEPLGRFLPPKPDLSPDVALVEWAGERVEDDVTVPLLDGGADGSGALQVLAVPVDAPLVHVGGRPAAYEFEDAWLTGQAYEFEDAW